MARVWEEASIVVGRTNAMLASGVGLFQLTVGALFDKDTAKSLKDHIEGLTDGEV